MDKLVEKLHNENDVMLLLLWKAMSEVTFSSDQSLDSKNFPGVSVRDFFHLLEAEINCRELDWEYFEKTGFIREVIKASSQTSIVMDSTPDFWGDY